MKSEATSLLLTHKRGGRVANHEYHSRWRPVAQVSPRISVKSVSGVKKKTHWTLSAGRRDSPIRSSRNDACWPLPGVFGRLRLSEASHAARELRAELESWYTLGCDESCGGGAEQAPTDVIRYLRPSLWVRSVPKSKLLEDGQYFPANLY